MSPVVCTLGHHNCVRTDGRDLVSALKQIVIVAIKGKLSGVLAWYYDVCIRIVRRQVVLVHKLVPNTFSSFPFHGFVPLLEPAQSWTKSVGDFVQTHVMCDAYRST